MLNVARLGRLMHDNSSLGVVITSLQWRLDTRHEGRKWSCGDGWWDRVGRRQ